MGIVKTKDFSTFERVAIASDLGNRNGCLFPEKFDNLYVRFDRPFGNELSPLLYVGLILQIWCSGEKPPGYVQRQTIS